MKSTNNIKSILSLAGVFLALFAYGQSQQQPKVKMGDVAPELKVKWIKGTPIDKYDDNKLYVMEFWATWCAPCIAMMPHLSELAKKYDGKVVFTGVDIWEKGVGDKPYETVYPKVSKFVEGMGPKMAYNVAMDNNEQHMGNNWMRAAGLDGIPASFLIKEGKILWIGHPGGVEKIIEEVLAGTYSVENYLAEIEKARQQQANDVRTQNFRALQNLGARVKNATESKDYAKAMHEIDSAKTYIAPEFSKMLKIMEFTTLLGFDVPKAKAFATAWKNETPADVVHIAYTISEMNDQPKDVYQFSIDLFTEALSLPNPMAALIYHYTAKDYFKMNDIDNAIASEEKAVKHAKESLAKGEFKGNIHEGTVAEYEGALEQYKLTEVKKEEVKKEEPKEGSKKSKAKKKSD